ncbi:hemolysin family protein [Arthrobacter sp.]|uniref:hemolysin family protein n=1 Tax=Arthrobacter sp. TaxID=1667 RepID=UPI0026DEA4DF|nr:hemolysin family protein [Arthrobacter sp.]MDO5752416.1 hemolysin family protein [Arthrobacter sp.]
MTLVALPIVGIIFTIVAAFMAALESALSFFPRHDAESVANHGRGGSLEKVLAEPQTHLNALRFWRVWSEMAAAVAVAIFLVGLIGNEWIAGLIGTVVMALLGFMLVGVSPRRLGRLHSGTLVGRSAWLIQLLCRILGPIPDWLILIGSAVAKDAPAGDETFVSEEEFREFVDRASESDMIEDNEAELIHSVFDLGETMVRAVMVPRTDIVSIDQILTLDEALEVFLGSGYSRIPVIAGSTDHILGILYLKDVVATLHRLSDGEDQPLAAQLARNVRYVPESKPVDDLLNELQRESTHMAIVVDEYGGTAGLVTLEDLIEEIVGEIADEYDLVAPDVQDLGDGRYRIRSRMAVDELGELFDKDLDDDEVDTVGGFMAKHLGKIPSLGNTVEVNGILLLVERMEASRNRVSHVIASAVEPADNDNTELRTLDAGITKITGMKHDGGTPGAANPTQQHHRSDHE